MNEDDKKLKRVGLHHTQGGWTQEAWDSQSCPETDHKELARILEQVPLSDEKQD